MFCQADGYGGQKTSDIYFFGHSLDLSDKDILSTLITKGNHIYVYYTDEDDRKEKIKNIIALSGKNVALNRINHTIIFYEIKEDCKHQ